MVGRNFFAPPYYSQRTVRLLRVPFSFYIVRDITKKGKASSLDIAPLTILNSGTFTTSKVAADWQ